MVILKNDFNVLRLLRDGISIRGPLVGNKKAISAFNSVLYLFSSLIHLYKIIIISGRFAETDSPIVPYGLFASILEDIIKFSLNILKSVKDLLSYFEVPKAEELKDLLLANEFKIRGFLVLVDIPEDFILLHIADAESENNIPVVPIILNLLAIWSEIVEWLQDI
ncbi:MAG: hypothetical protein ACFFC6_13415 [Promethearchaeota archaeon]